MKKSTIIVMALAVVLSLFSCSKANHYVVNGEVKEGICPDGEWAYLWNDVEHKLLDSVQITNGAFRFEGEVAEPCVAVVKHPFYFNGEKQNVSAAASQFILEAGEINANMIEDIPQPTGTPLNDKLTEIFKNVISTYSAIEEGELSEDAAAEQLMTLFYEQSKENIDNPIALLLLTMLAGELHPEQELELYMMLPEDKQAYFAEPIEAAKKAIGVSAGNEYIDFSVKNEQGEVVSLKSVVEKEGNKYVLLDFWASWCQPCLHQMPQLKALYDKYHSKGLEVFALSIDENVGSWQAAVEKIGMEWQNFCDPQAVKEIADKYGVQFIPSNFLIDAATGKIIGRNLSVEALDEKLNELL